MTHVRSNPTPARWTRGAVWSLVALGTLAAWAEPPVDQPPPPLSPATPASKRTIVHIVVLGDLDNGRVVTKLRAELAEAASAEAEGVLLELGGERWRTDLLLDLCELVSRSSAPIAVFLNDPRDKAVGAGAWAVGVAAGACFVSGDVHLIVEPGDDQRQSSPRAGEWGSLTASLIAKLRTGLGDLGGPPELATILVGVANGAPSELAWAITPKSAEDPARVAVVDPARSTAPGERSTPIVLEAAVNARRAEIPGPLAARLRIVRASVAGSGAVLAEMGWRGLPENTVAIEGDARTALARVRERLTEIDAELERATQVLDLPKPPDPGVAPSRYQQAGRDAKSMLDRAAALLAECEAATEEFPELLSGPAPGQSAVGGTASTFAAKWRSSFQTRRDKIEKLGVKAGTFAER